MLSQPFLLHLILWVCASRTLATTPKKEPYHVAIVVGCHSHGRLHNHIAYSLHNRSSLPNKYRVTYVTGRQCRDVPERIKGINIFDTGVWFYPSKDPDMPAAEYLLNYTRGEILYPTSALDSLIQQDRPDLIISDNICLATGTVAEKHDIPYVLAFRPSIPPISMYAQGRNLGLGFTFNHIPNPGMPDWYFGLCAAYWYRILITIFWFFTKDAVKDFETMRLEANLPVFDNIFHVTNSYPMIAYFDDTILARKDIHPKLTTVGILPHEPDDPSRISAQLLSFIEQSEDPVLYVSIGTRNTFSDEETKILKEVFETQNYFRVIWAHRTWNNEMMGKIDWNRLFVQAVVPQREILSHPKVRVFMSHCATGGYTEGIARGKVFIGVPQRGDHFYLAESINKWELGVVVSPEPSESEMKVALKTVHENMDQFARNVGKLHEKLSHNSVERLENIVDWLIAQKHVVVFGFEESNVISLRNSLAVLILTVLAVLVIPLVLIIIAAVNCCSKPKLGKQKLS